MAAVVSQLWENVRVSGSNLEVVSANQYLRISGKTLFRRLLVLLSAIFVFGTGMGYGGYRSLQQWNLEQMVQRGLDTLCAQMLPRAFYDTADRSSHTLSVNGFVYDGINGPPRCYPTSISTAPIGALADIHRWATQPVSNTARPIFWLHGPAYGGKSALVQSISEQWYDEEQLAASYFFSWKSADRKEKVLVVPTLAYQLQLSLGPRYRVQLAMAVIQDPSIFTRSMRAQVDKLIRKPLTMSLDPNHQPHPFFVQLVEWFYTFHWVSSKPAVDPKIIVIDGLNEVLDSEAQRELLESLGELVLDPGSALRLFISSRPSSHIQHTFNSASAFNASTSRLELIGNFGDSNCLAEDQDSYPDIQMQPEHAQAHIQSRDHD